MFTVHIFFFAMFQLLVLFHHFVAFSSQNMRVSDDELTMDG